MDDPGFFLKTDDDDDGVDQPSSGHEDNDGRDEEEDDDNVSLDKRSVSKLSRSSSLMRRETYVTKKSIPGQFTLR